MKHKVQYTTSQNKYEQWHGKEVLKACHIRQGCKDKTSKRTEDLLQKRGHRFLHNIWEKQLIHFQPYFSETIVLKNSTLTHIPACFLIALVKQSQYLQALAFIIGHEFMQLELKDDFGYLMHFALFIIEQQKIMSN